MPRNLWFGQIYVFFVMRLGTREILHWNVTYHPTSEWTVQQLKNALAWSGRGAPRYLLRDRDDKFGRHFNEIARSAGSEPIVTSSPFENARAARGTSSKPPRTTAARHRARRLRRDHQPPTRWPDLVINPRARSRPHRGQIPEKGTRPADIPADPGAVYGRGWTSMGDWLGTGRVATCKRTYRSFAAARSFARSLGLKSAEAWRVFARGGMPEKGKLPSDVPASPI